MTVSSPANQLLEVLPTSSAEEFSAHLEPINLPVKFTMVQANQIPEHVYFITAGLASVVANNPDDEHIEVGHIGYEGMTATHLLHHVDTTPASTYMQIAGTGLRMKADVFLDIVERDNAVRTLFLRYVHCSELQLAYSSLSNARYTVNERLARWLLMCHDRMRHKDVRLTHEFMALMLGVRRSGVTIAIHALESLKAIKASRGNIRVTNRSMLLRIAGGSYGVPEAEYKRLIGDFTPQVLAPPRTEPS
ncbi:MAG: Crp/Fnr family transcriptional regulator [Cytophagaceae bacterium]|nr:MAG: Crp/Fnr family transcriptional regulator [Cytophagaceae bacterium]